ncbi:MAG: hypothetical protein EOP45_13020 [Sphingobacteriaceae bacterium]|nr:MAG: hypothetical protein EOP45_13020 [Sphingobacteriaceae bacterium]
MHEPVYEGDLCYAVAFDDSVYCIWQAEILLYNFQKLGIDNQLWFPILYTNRILGPSDAAKRLAKLHSNVRFYYNDFPNTRWGEYKAVCKTYGVAKLLEEIPCLGGCLFLMDHDIMFTRPIAFTTRMIQDDLIYGSETASYLSFNHFHRDRDVSLTHMTNLTNIVGPDLVDAYKKAEDKHSLVGAQYLFKQVDAAFFRKISIDAWNMHEYALKIQAEGNSMQIWVAEMQSVLLNSIQRVGVDKVKESPILDFTWATNDINSYQKHAIVHFAGVTSGTGQFNKQNYIDKPPWAYTDFNYITNTKTCAQKWLEECMEYAWLRYGIRMIIPV